MYEYSEYDYRKLKKALDEIKSVYEYNYQRSDPTVKRLSTILDKLNVVIAAYENNGCGDSK